LRDIELKVQREIQEKRVELMNKEEALRSLEARLTQAQIADA
jgi:cell division control protein 11